MNILNLLTKQKQVAGIEISDSVVRIAFFRPLKKKRGLPIIKEGDKKDELILIEEPISPDIIVDGVVIDIDLLGKTLKNIWTKATLGTEYAVVAIPDDKIYSKVFSFPKSINDARVNEAMHLAVSFQLPMKTEDVYLDWERTLGTTTSNEILLSTIPREVAEGYVQALDRAGIKTIALESHLASIARAVKQVPGETSLFSKNTPDGATVFALRDGILRFSRTLPFRYIPENKIDGEIKKVSDALKTDKIGITTQELLKADVRDEYSEYPQITEPKAKWLVALGAAIRGTIPEGMDNLVSLLPIGTEEAYAYQRATTFIILLRNLVVGVSLFFIATYISTYLFIVYLAEDTNERIVTLSASSAPLDLTDKEKRISDVNILTETGATLLSQMPLWSNVVAGVSERTITGITISTFSAPSFTGNISITGTAVSRDVLNNYKKSLQDSPLLTEIELPLANLAQKENIPFSVSFRLKDPSAIYYK